MGGGIGQILNQGKSALATAQTGMATTSHNVSNVNTEGYSRQRTDQVTGEPVPVGKARVGGGVLVGAITRSHSDFIQRRMEEEGSHAGRAEGAAEVFQQLESVFKDDAEQGISASVSKFFNNVRSLSTQPESVPLRSAVRESAQSITTRFRGIADSVGGIRDDLDHRIEGNVSDVNQLTTKIAALNQRIVEVEVSGGHANDERDTRDLAVRNLSKIVEVQTSDSDNGSINVSVGRIGPLVNGIDAYKLQAVNAPDGAGGGAMRVMVENGAHGLATRDVTDLIEGGAMGGYIQLRDQTIPGFSARIDNLAFELANQVNDAHRDAYGRDGARGADFFTDPGSAKGAASRLQLSGAIQNDVNAIATADRPNAAGDNRALLRIADLQDARVFEKGKASFTDYTASIIGSLGVEAKSANEALDTQRGVMEQLNTLHEQTSGVSLDEEAMGMLKYQKAFDASAKMIQTADSMLETILNLKRF